MYCLVWRCIVIIVFADILGTRKYIPAITVINKVDSVSMETMDRLAREGDGRTVMISCEIDLGLDWLLETIWQVCQNPFEVGDHH